jgi:beta-galactosidase/beta-glucuronidase
VVLVYWTIQWENTPTLQNAEDQLQEMVARDRNRASVIIYSVANETPISEPRNRFLRELIHEVHAADPRVSYRLLFKPRKKMKEVTRPSKSTTRLPLISTS